MRGGKLDIRITIQRKTVTTSNSGASIETWSDLTTVWASISPLTGSERLVGESLNAKEQVQFKIRWSTAVASLSPQDRILYPITVDSPSDPEYYDIVQASDMGRKEDILILAYRYVNS